MRSKKMEKWISTEFWNHNAKEDFFMAKEYFMDEVAVLKKIVQEAGRMREYSENEMSDLIDHKIQERIEWARQNDEGLYWYYQNLSFKDKKTLK